MRLIVKVGNVDIDFDSFYFIAFKEGKYQL
jgi:hypothetical protein